MAGSNPRRILISVDNSDACEQAVNWVMTNLYKQGDELASRPVFGFKHLCTDY